MLRPNSQTFTSLPRVTADNVVVESETSDGHLATTTYAAPAGALPDYRFQVSRSLGLTDMYSREAAVEIERQTCEQVARAMAAEIDRQITADISAAMSLPSFSSLTTPVIRSVPANSNLRSAIGTNGAGDVAGQNYDVLTPEIIQEAVRHLNAPGPTYPPALPIEMSSGEALSGTSLSDLLLCCDSNSPVLSGSSGNIFASQGIGNIFASQGTLLHPGVTIPPVASAPAPAITKPAPRPRGRPVRGRAPSVIDPEVDLDEWNDDGNDGEQA